MKATTSSLFLVLLAVGFPACGAKSEKTESETHFLCALDDDCSGAGDRSVCVSGQCVTPEAAAMGDTSMESEPEPIPETTTPSDGDDDDGERDDPARGGTNGVPTVDGTPDRAGASGVGGSGPLGTGGAAGSGSSPEVNPNVAGVSGIAGSSGAGGMSAEGDSCEPLYAPAEEAEVVELEVRNQRSMPIMLGDPVGCEPIVVAVESLNETTPGAWRGPHCVIPCSLSLDGAVGCTADCPAPLPVVIMPGESATIEWNGLLQQTTEVPEQCCNNPDYCPTECPLVKAAAAGAYRASLAFLEVTEEEAMQCTPERFDCPVSFVQPSDLEQLELDFELGNGDIVLEVATP